MQASFSCATALVAWAKNAPARLMLATPHSQLQTAATHLMRILIIIMAVTVFTASLATSVVVIIGWIALVFGQKQALRMRGAFMRVATDT